MENGESTPGINLNGREATEFAFLDKNVGKWDNTEKRLAPPRTAGLFEETIIETMTFLGATVDEVETITKRLKRAAARASANTERHDHEACASTPGKDQEGKRQR